jgi:hypothetical protein
MTRLCQEEIPSKWIEQHTILPLLLLFPDRLIRGFQSPRIKGRPAQKGDLKLKLTTFRTENLLKLLKVTPQCCHTR